MPVAATTIVTMAGHGPMRRPSVAGHTVRERAVAGLGPVATGQGAVCRQDTVARYRTMTVTVAVTMTRRVVGVRVRVTVMGGVTTNAHSTFLLLGNLLYGQETVLPHLYPLGHIPYGGVFCKNQQQSFPVV